MDFFGLGGLELHLVVIGDSFWCWFRAPCVVPRITLGQPYSLNSLEALLLGLSNTHGCREVGVSSTELSIDLILVGLELPAASLKVSVVTLWVGSGTLSCPTRNY